MGEVHYMISEAAKRVEADSQILEYWEEELELPIERTEMGHRFYTEEDIQLLRCIKELKEQGIQLKDLKGLIPDMLRTKEQLKQRRKKREEYEHEISNFSVDNALEDKMEQIFRMVLLDNNHVLESGISQVVSNKVTKEIDYLLQAKERQEEEQFRKLDHLIRQQQTM
ncbi:MAG: MerR family transcriptional regulator, partial [Lachnospiraceae bacterium]